MAPKSKDGIDQFVRRCDFIDGKCAPKSDDGEKKIETKDDTTNDTTTEPAEDTNTSE